MMLRDTGFAFLKVHSRPLIFIGVILALAIYTAGVPRHPPGFYIDESSISYNAYTIAQSGHDEHGVLFPLFFRAFGDYKNPVYIYLLAGLFKLAGPSILVARLLSAASGLLAAFLLGLLATRVTRRRAVGIFIAVNALLTPWLFETSRVVMEVALYPATLALFLLCLRRAYLKVNWSRLDVAGLAISLALLTYTYSVGRLLAPLLALGLVIFMTRERWPSVMRTWCAYALTLLPLFVFGRHNPGALTGRFKSITYITPQDTYREIATDFIKHFVGNFNPLRLLATGDPNTEQVVHIFGTGHLLLATAMLAAFGGWLVLRDHRSDAWWRFILYGLVVSAIPASLTNDYFHMLRLIAMPVFILVLTIPACAWLIERANAGRLRRAGCVALLILTLLQASIFQWQFYRSSGSPRRLHLFDAAYPQAIFAPALATRSRPIYLADNLAIPGYIQAYWYATLQKIDPAQFRLLPATDYPPAGATVISTEERCSGCQVIAKSEPYTLYVANVTSRRHAPLPMAGFRAEIYLPSPPTKLPAGEKATIRVRVKNISGAVWLGQDRSGDEYQISLGNHWLDSQGRTVANDDGRSALPADLRPGEETELPLTINTPRRAGQYVLEIDMLQEGVTWFGLTGSSTQRLRIEVE
jgi:4-amino-4-deoxy-L-arabinose transferase-like glycosyltransferase